jgi:hypothetical protein
MQNIGTFYAHWVYAVDIWRALYIMENIGIFYGHLW